MLFIYLVFFYDSKAPTRGDNLAAAVLGICDIALWIYMAIHFSSVVH